MPEITLSLADELHARLAALATQAGQSPSEFALAALLEKIEDALQNAGMDAEADRRWAEFQQTGKSISLDVVEKRLEQRLAELSPPPG
ncbi:CopG family transcriptional regulator [Oxalobacteraceae bacterium A2-2]